MIYKYIIWTAFFLNFFSGALVCGDSLTRSYSTSPACERKIAYVLPGILLGCYLGRNEK
jgi:hypothetical protein